MFPFLVIWPLPLEKGGKNFGNCCLEFVIIIIIIIYPLTARVVGAPQMISEFTRLNIGVSLAVVIAG